MGKEHESWFMESKEPLVGQVKLQQ